MATATSPDRLPGALLLFRFRDIPVFLHWTWAPLAIVFVTWQMGDAGPLELRVLAYIGLFAIVLLHEFGHALACRSVGGTVSHVLLWPLGGVAHVRPPLRPAAVLWSIAAGPLVNLVLAVVALGLWSLTPGSLEMVRNFLLGLGAINVGLFVFNMLPVYPLDGGQILRSLLWFGIGREWSLVVTAGLGLVLAALGAIWALDLGRVLDAEVWSPDLWLSAIAAYAAYHSWRGLRAARTLQRLAAGPRHLVARCPSCGEPPPSGLAFRCANDHLYDAFATQGTCPQCGDRVDAIRCIFCGVDGPTDAWDRPIHVRPRPAG